MSRRWIVTSAVAVGLSLLIAIGLLVVYPKVGAWAIREKAGARLAKKLGREVRFGAIDISIGHATLRDVEVRGPNDGDTPLVHVDRIEVEFDPWRSLVGSVRLGAVRVDGVVATVRRGPDGVDNVSDVLARLSAERAAGASGEGSGGGMRPTSIRVTRARLLADDGVTSSTALVADGDASWTPGELTAELRGITATTIAAPKAGAAKIAITRRTGEPPIVRVEGGEISLDPKLALSGIAGTVHPNPERAGEYVIDLAGGYGGVPGNLWTAKGQLDPKAATASIDLVAAKFQLDRLAPILARTAVVDYANTSVDTHVHLAVSRGGAKFAGEFHLYGLNIGHPMLADKEVHDLDLSGKIDGSFDRESRRLELTRGDFQARDVRFSVTGSASTKRKPRVEAVAAVAPPAKSSKKPLPPPGPPVRGPRGLEELDLHLVIPPVDCQRMLKAIPTEMAPYMAGYEMRGMFSSDIRVAIDWSDLDATILEGTIPYRNCRVTKHPADSPKRLEEEFEHFVEVETGKWLSFIVGPENPDFVPFEEISTHLVNSVMSTEDSGFFKHRGFIPSEFRKALINNLKAGKFKQGASSITMQMVKNVLLFREKTLARKLQELFLTWQVESDLTKDRILEIYFNVIEYGPALYGIGPAAKHYFGKAPKDLNPVEATFFSSILPAPKERYKQYCAGALKRWTEDKIKGYLKVMLTRNRLTQAEYDTALTTPLVFVKDGEETEEECLKRTQKIIKNARSTNPMKQTDAPPRKRPSKDDKDDKARASDGQDGDDEKRERREKREKKRRDKGGDKIDI